MVKNHNKTGNKEMPNHEDVVDKDVTIDGHENETLTGNSKDLNHANQSVYQQNKVESVKENIDRGQPSHGYAQLDNDRHVSGERVAIDDHRHHRPYDVPVGAIRREHHEVGSNLSWRAVLGGLVTFIALSILFSLIGASIGLGVTDVTAQQPLEGVGMGMIIWTILSLVASLAAAGYVAGYLANRAGFIHGFLTWALGLIAATMLASSALTGAFNVFGSMLGVTGKTAGDAVGTITQKAGDLSQDAFDAVADDLELDTSNLDQEVEKVLKDSEIESLQPNFLQNQLDDTVADIQEAAKSVVVDGQPIDQSLQGVYDNIDQRLEVIGQDLDEEALSNSVAENTDLSDAEADEAVQNIQNSYAKAQTEAKEVLNNAKTEMNKLESEAGQAIEDGKETTDDVMNEASKYSIYAFIGSLLAMILSSFAGKKGAEKGQELEDDRVLNIDETVVE